MRQLTYHEPGKLSWDDVPDPVLKGGEDAIVRPIAVTTCDLDNAVLVGNAPIPGPYAFGHELVAEVIEIGDRVETFRAGDRVIVPFQIACGRCGRCMRGITASCERVPPRSMYGFGALGGEWGGAFSERLRVPFADAMLLRLRDALSPESVASLSDNMPDAYRTVGPHLEETPGAPVLIVGGGAPSIGLYAVAIAKALGASRVDYIDRDKARLALAESLGAKPIEGPPPRKAGEYPITVDASANEDGLACALRSVTPYGVCTSVGIYYGDTQVPLLDMYGRGVRFITGRANARADMPKVLALVESKRFSPEHINTRVAPMEHAIEVLLEGTMKPVFIAGSQSPDTAHTSR
jgi:alcohol dehydrogenase